MAQQALVVRYTYKKSVSYRGMGRAVPSPWSYRTQKLIIVQIFLLAQSTQYFFRRLTIFFAERETQNKKSYSRFLFFGFESRRDQESR